MSEQTDALRALRRAAKRRERTERARREATAELQTRLREAKQAGVSIAQIAREAGLSRQGVYDLLGQRPSPQG
jgi:DNA-binding phage protein